MKRLLVYLSLLGFVFLIACKPEPARQSPLATLPLSPVEPRPTDAPSPIPTATRTPLPVNMIVHVVQPGDTIMGLALQYNVPMEQIYQLNGLTSNSLLRVGQELVIGDQNTAAATATPQPTLTATPPQTIVPPISLASSSNQPALTQDLLYLRDGYLIRWNHFTRQQEVLAGPDLASQPLLVQPVANRINGPGPLTGTILGYSMGADGQFIVVNRWTRVKSGSELGLLDLNTRAVTVFYTSDSPGVDLLAMSVSPDGKYVAWIPQDRIPVTGQRRVNGLAAPARGGGLRTGSIFIAPLDEPDQKREIGYCGGQQTPEYNWGCQGLLWSPDSQSIAWADGNGVWLTDLKGSSRQLIQTALTMPGGRQAQGVYTVREWSPSGRYLLLKVDYYEGSSLSTLDVTTGQTAPIPNSFGYAYPGPPATWTHDDRLFVGRPGRGRIDLRPSLEIWRIDVSNDITLTVTHSSALNVGPENVPLGLTQNASGRLALALVNHSNTNYIDRGLYFADANTLVLKKVNGLPPLGRENDGMGGPFYNVDVVWTVDGGEAVIEDHDSHQLLYASTTDMILYDLRPLLGDSAADFHWVD